MMTTVILIMTTMERKAPEGKAVRKPQTLCVLDSNLGDCGVNDENNYDEGRDEKFYKRRTLLVTMLKIFF